MPEEITHSAMKRVKPLSETKGSRGDDEHFLKLIKHNVIYTMAMS